MDQDLVVRVQQGDQHAFETLTVADYSRLFRVANGILGDPHLAEDATQQAFLDIWRDIRRLKDPAKFEGWSYRLLVRVCYSEVKRRPDSLLGSRVVPANEPRAADAYSVIEDREQLDRGFQRLSMDHRVVLVLHYLLGMTAEQVAETLGISRWTVYSRLGRAVKAMRTALEADARPGPSGGRAMTDERMRPVLETWFRDRDIPPADPRRSAHRVMTRVPQVQQRGRWWWLPSYRRTPARPPTTDQTTNYQSTSIPAPNGHTPTVTGRTQSMFSPVKTITAGAIVFAIGGAFLIAQPFGQQGGNVPGAAEAGAFEPVPFTLRFEPGEPVREERTNTEDGVTEVLGACFAPSILNPSDPRVAGSVTFCRAEHHYGVEGADGPVVWSRTYRIENDEGAWQGSSTGAEWPDPASGSNVETQEVFTLVGEDAYQGLYATMAFLPDKRSIQGVIIGGPPPEAPVLPATD